MLTGPEAQRLLTSALEEFAPDWAVAGSVAPVSIREPDPWLSGVGTFGVTLRHRTTGAVKVLGRRGGAGPGAEYHRGISFLVLEAYRQRNTDPIRRYLAEVRLVPGPEPGPRVLSASR